MSVSPELANLFLRALVANQDEAVTFSAVVQGISQSL
jgi:hypothetical protein